MAKVFQAKHSNIQCNANLLKQTDRPIQEVPKNSPFSQKDTEMGSSCGGNSHTRALPIVEFRRQKFVSFGYD